VLLGLAVFVLALQSASAHAQTQIVRPPATLGAEKEKMNAWSVGLAGCLLEGAPKRASGDFRSWHFS
jgi:hypothetical protein